MEDSVICKLQKPVKYGTDNKETEFVEIRCPSYDGSGQRKYRRELKAMLAGIIVEENSGREITPEQEQEAQEKLKDGELPFTPGQILLTISAALGDDFPGVIDRFCIHADKFVYLGGDELLKSGTINRMDPDDIDMIFSTFIANFIMPSLLKSLSGSE